MFQTFQRMEFSSSNGIEEEERKKETEENDILMNEQNVTLVDMITYLFDCHFSPTNYSI